MHVGDCPDGPDPWSLTGLIQQNSYKRRSFLVGCKTSWSSRLCARTPREHRDLPLYQNQALSDRGGRTDPMGLYLPLPITNGIWFWPIERWALHSELLCLLMIWPMKLRSNWHWYKFIESNGTTRHWRHLRSRSVSAHKFVARGTDVIALLSGCIRTRAVTIVFDGYLIIAPL